MLVFLSTLLAQADPNAPKPAIQIPGFQGFSKITQDAANAAVMNVPYLSEYIAALFKFAIGAGAIIAAFMIAIGGFQYVSSAGIPKNVASAKRRITNALTGLLLLLGSYVVLYSINPDLVAMKSISLLTVPRIQLEDSGNETETPQGAERVSAFDSNFNISSCPDLVSLDGLAQVSFGPNAHHALRDAPAKALGKAMTEWLALYPGEILTVNRDYRTTGEQKYLYDGYKAKEPGFAPAAKPGTSNHERGDAVDISVSSLPTVKYTALLKIMEANGFKVLGNGSYDSTNVPADWAKIAERWHFDYKVTKLNKPIECTSQPEQEPVIAPLGGI